MGVKNGSINYYGYGYPDRPVAELKRMEVQYQYGYSLG